MKKYEYVNHTADCAFKVFGQTMAELFQNAACALFDTLTDRSLVRPLRHRAFNLHKSNQEELLVEWLGVLLYVFDTELFLFSRFRIDVLQNGLLSAEASGEPLEQGRHILRTEVKAVTYHDLSITRKDTLWNATIVLDL